MLKFCRKLFIGTNLMFFGLSSGYVVAQNAVAKNENNYHNKARCKSAELVIKEQVQLARLQMDSYHNSMRAIVLHQATNDAKATKEEKLKAEKELTEATEKLEGIPRLSTLVDHQRQLAEKKHADALNEADEALNLARHYANCYEDEKNKKAYAIETSAKNLSKLLTSPSSKYSKIKLSSQGTNLYIRHYDYSR